MRHPDRLSDEDGMFSFGRCADAASDGRPGPARRGIERALDELPARLMPDPAVARRQPGVLLPGARGIASELRISTADIVRGRMHAQGLGRR